VTGSGVGIVEPSDSNTTVLGHLKACIFYASSFSFLEKWKIIVLTVTVQSNFITTDVIKTCNV
jgi:hypothetical protein